jgi:hypothetical protein
MRLHTLWRSMEILGDAERLRNFLGRVPADSLQAWLSGDAPPPERVFLRAADIVMAHKLSLVRGCAENKPGCCGSRANSIQVLIGQRQARCPACDNTDFEPADPAAGLKLNNRTELVCVCCALKITRGDLVDLAGKESANRSAARVAGDQEARAFRRTSDRGSGRSALIRFLR